MVGLPRRGSRSVRVFATSYSQSKHPAKHSDTGVKGRPHRTSSQITGGEHICPAIDL